MSPVLADGLDQSHAKQWTKVWSVEDYEPDNLCAVMTGGGAIVSYDGWLYWSTMHVKNQAQVYLAVNGLEMSSADKASTPKGAYRAIAIFRGRNLDNPATKEIELLYGEEYLDVYSFPWGWQAVPNKMDASNRAPKYGHSGFGNMANNYTWSMAVFDGTLYVGTMDELGADLYCFPNAESQAEPVNIHGLGNIANHGIRTMAADDDYLYMGTASHYNISTYTAEAFISANPEFALFEDTSSLSGVDATGGWDLVRLKRK